MKDPNQEVYEAEIHGLSHDGRAVGRLPDGLAVFVPGALPGQRIRLAISARKKKLAEGRLLEVLRPAPEERPLPCPHGQECGGCPWQALPYALQLEWKQRQLQDALTRIGHLDVTGKMEPVQGVFSHGMAVEWGYRNKMEFSFGQDATGHTRLGLYRRASRQLVEVSGCLLQTRRSMRVLERIREWRREAGLSAWEKGKEKSGACLRFAVIREPQWERDIQGNSGDCLVEIISGPLPSRSRAALAIQELGKALLAEGLGNGFVHSLRAAPSAVAYGERTLFSLGKTDLVEKICLKHGDEPTGLHLGHSAFFQVNAPAAQLLYQSALALSRELCPEEAAEAWDLYCGVGGLSLGLAGHFQQVLGLENMPGAVELAQLNATGRSNLGFVLADAAKLQEFLAERGKPTLICADPPRGGLAPQTLQALLRSGVPHLVLVSCNPASLARDLAALNERYELRKVQAFDLFPQTPHVESLAGLSLR